MTSIPTVIPICFDCLPLNGTHNLYAAILENPVSLFMIEQDQEFKRTPLVHNYIQLYHNYVRAQVDLTTSSTLSAVAVQRWSNCLAAMWFKVLQLLMLAEFGKFFEQCVPTDLFQSLLHTTLTLLPKVYREEYLVIEGETFILADSTILPSSSDPDVHEDTSVHPVSPPPMVPAPVQSPHPVPPPAR